MSRPDLDGVSLKGWPPSAIPLKACAEDAAKHGSDIILTTLPQTLCPFCLQVEK